MTCIAGLVDNGTVWLGGDSAGVNSNFQLHVRADQKVFENGSCVMGFTTSFRMGQLLRYAFHIPRSQEDQDVYEYMVTTFINGVRDALKAGGWAVKEKEKEEGGTFLVGYRGRLFLIDSDYQVGEFADGYGAVGCGDDIAQGALFATVGMEPKKRILTALRAAERFSAGVRGPFHVIKGGRLATSGAPQEARG